MDIKTALAYMRNLGVALNDDDSEALTTLCDFVESAVSESPHNELLRILEFDRTGYVNPTYGCNFPGDNSGLYVSVEDLKPVILNLETFSGSDEHASHDAHDDAVAQLRSIISV